MSKKISVKLPENDWNDLVSFMIGDLHNMDCGDPVAAQMSAILDEIRKAVAIQSSQS